jgi:hypothetical protein
MNARFSMVTPRRARGAVLILTRPLPSSGDVNALADDALVTDDGASRTCASFQTLVF